RYGPLDSPPSNQQRWPRLAGLHAGHRSNTQLTAIPSGSCALDLLEPRICDDHHRIAASSKLIDRIIRRHGQRLAGRHLVLVDPADLHTDGRSTGIVVERCDATVVENCAVAVDGGKESRSNRVTFLTQAKPDAPDVRLAI